MFTGILLILTQPNGANQVKRLAIVCLALSVTACTGVDTSDIPTEFTVVDFSSESVTISDPISADDPWMLAEAERLCGLNGKRAVFVAEREGKTLNRAATSIASGLTGSSRPIYQTEYVFACLPA